MIVIIRDPREQQPFPHFTHNTTTYVGIPHNSQSQLWISTDTTSTILIEADGNIIFRSPAQTTHEVTLSGIQQPNIPINVKSGIMSAIFPFTTFHPKERLDLPAIGSILQQPASPIKTEAAPGGSPLPLRLYAFRVLLYATSTDPQPSEGELIATFDFHILCQTDWQWAQILHMQLQQDPQAISPATIGERAEGTCPVCATVRQRLEKDWQQKK